MDGEHDGHDDADRLWKSGLGRAKFEKGLYEWCQANGIIVSAKNPPQAYLFKMPYSVVRPYGSADALDTLQILQIQLPILVEQDLMDVFNLECKLIRTLMKFRKTGVRIDNDRRMQNAFQTQNIAEENKQVLFSKYGKCNVNSSQQ